MYINLDMYVKQCAPQVSSNTMLAIIKTESKGNPLAIGLNKGKRLGYQAKNLDQAVNWVEYLDKHGYDFDVGLAQINVRNIRKYGYKAKDMLDPCKNLYVANLILSKNYTNALVKSNNPKQALLKAISAYNTGNYQYGFNNGYVQKVVNNAISMDEKNLAKLAVTSNDKLSKSYILNSSRSVVYAKTKEQIYKQYAQN